MKKYALLLVTVGFFGAISASALEITNVQAPEKVPFAQPFELHYQLADVSTGTVTLDETSLSPDFEITQAQFQPQPPMYSLTVVPFTLGKSTFTVSFQQKQDGHAVSYAADPVEIEITPVKVFNDDKFREIRSPYIPAAWWRWLIVLLFAAAVIYAILHLRKRLNERARELHFAQDTRPCEEIAFSKINGLLDSGVWERKAYKVFYTTLLEILCEYLWRRFRADTTADTSVELLRRVKTIPALRPLLVPLKDFLNSSDLVNFARVEPTEETRNKDVQIVRQIVTETSMQEKVIPPQEDDQ